MKRFLIALFFAAAVALAHFIVPRDEYYFELSAQSGNQTAIVFYTDFGRGFNDDEQFTTTLYAQKSPSLHRFALISGKLRGFRLDFIDVGGPVSLGGLRIVTHDGSVIQQFRADQFKLGQSFVSGSQSDSFELVPAGVLSSSIELHFQEPLQLPSLYNVGRRSLVTIPWLVGAFAVAWFWFPRLQKSFAFDELCVAKSIPSQREATPSLAGEDSIPWLSLALTLMGAAAILFVRMPDRLLYPQFYAEDGYFYSCAIESGLKALAMPYGGYLLTADRLIAAFGTLLPALYVPAFFNICALLVVLAVLARVFSPRITLPFKPLLALAVVMIGRPQDIFLTITNIQWVMALGLILLLFSEDARRPRQYVYDLVFALVAGVTGVYSVLLLPFFLWRAVRRKSRHSLILAGIIGCTAAIQAYFVIHTPPTIPDSLPFSVATAARVIALRYFCLPFGGPWLVYSPKWFLSVAAGIYAGWALYLCCHCPKGSQERRSLRWFILAIIVVFTAASLFRFKGALVLLLKHGGTRYFFIGEVLFVWLLIFNLRSHLLRRWLAGVALYAFVVTTLCTFRLEPFVDCQWSNYAPLVDQGKDVWFPINPAGWRGHISEVKK